MNKITTEEEYQAALSMVEDLFDAPPDSPEEAELMRLVTLIEEYEDEQYPMP
jgi:HTH-type transcriptional regulator / antitoxin HigA